MVVPMPPLPQGVTEGDVLHLRRLMGSNFTDAQKTVASHRKIVAALKNYQDRASGAGLEDEFNRTFVRMVNRVLPVKKGEKCADRIIKLVESFVSFIQEKEDKETGENDDEDEEEDTVASRFVEYLIKHLLQGIEAKSKTVRFRVCYLIAVTINHLGEISNELFDSIKYSLCKRLYDKEQSVRLQASLALCRLQGADDEDDDPTSSVSKLLISALQHDSSPEVRRAVLLNLERSGPNLPYLLERAWDVHPTNRKMVYARVMKDIGDFRLLTISMREKILQWGLQDRDQAVKDSAIRMFVDQWIPATNNDLIEVLERLDVLNSDIGEVAMRVFFTQRRDTLHKIEFSADFWQNLSAESVFLARTYNEFCVENKLQELIDDRLPELTKWAQLIETYLQKLDQEPDDAEIAFIVDQLLIIAETYDFADEVGRRHMLSLMRDSLVNSALSDLLVQRCVQVIWKVAVSESDFSQVIVEAISDIQDAVVESHHQEETQAHVQLVAVLKCLSIAKSTLEMIRQPLEDNPHLTTIHESLIVPAIRSREVPVRSRGLRCLGLCCLLSQDLATTNLMLFGQCFTHGDEELQIEAIKIISDILIVHGTKVLDTPEGVDSRSVYKLYYRGVLNGTEDVQAVAAEALCKLLLGGVIAEEDLIKTLVLGFFSSTDNAALQQILSYSLPVYCYSSLENQQRMARVVADSFRRLMATDTSVGATQIIQQMLDWTDPRRLVKADTPEAQNSTIHVDLCGELLNRIYHSDLKEERKALCTNLIKLHFPVSAPLEKVDRICQQVAHLIDEEIVSDTVSKNALVRFKSALEKALAKLQDAAEYEPNPEANTQENTTYGEPATADRTIVPPGGPEGAESPSPAP